MIYHGFMRPSNLSNSEWSPETIFAERLRFEYELIGQRMTWLMTLNSFVVGSGAVLAANSDSFDGTHVLPGAALLLGMLGILSNASCLFSNYWATRALHDSGLVLDRHWSTLSSDERERRRTSMTLFGRDPRQVHRHGAPPPSHPDADPGGDRPVRRHVCGFTA